MASITVASLLGLTLLGLSLGDAPNVGASLGPERVHFDAVVAAEDRASAPVCLLQRASAALQPGGAALEAPIFSEVGVPVRSIRDALGRALDGIEHGSLPKPEAKLTPHKPTTSPPPQEQEHKVKVSESEVNSTTSSLTFLGLLLLVLSLFYLTNFPDEDIQRAAWSLLSYSTSIFSAMLIFHVYRAAVALFWELFDVAYVEEPSAPGRTAVIFHSAQLLIIYAVLHGSLYAFRGWKSTLTAVGTLGAHVLGFSSIDAYGTLQRVAFFSETPGQSFYAVLVAAGAMLGGSVAHACVREVLVGSALERWKRQCCVSEREAAGLAVGYLLSQAAKFVITGHMPTSAITRQSEGEAWRFLTTALAFAVLLVLMSAGLRGLIHAGVSAWPRQLAQALQSILAMSVGWCLLYCGESLFWDAASVMASGICLLLAFAGVGILVILLVNLFEGRCCNFAEKRCLQALVSALGLLLGFAFQACASEALVGLGAALALPASAEAPLVRFAGPPLLLLLVLPAWAVYILPRATLAARAKAPDSEPQLAAAAAFQAHASESEQQPAPPLAAVVQVPRSMQPTPLAPRSMQPHGGFLAGTGF